MEIDWQISWIFVYCSEVLNEFDTERFKADDVRFCNTGAASDTSDFNKSQPIVIFSCWEALHEE